MAADLIDEVHAQAVLALLRVGGGVTVYDGEVPDPPEPGVGVDLPYLLVHISIGWPSTGTANAIDGQSITAAVSINCHCVGETAASARAMQMQARTRLLNARPVVAGRSCTLIDLDEALAPNKDQMTGRTIFDAVSNFSFTSVPA